MAIDNIQAKKTAEDQPKCEGIKKESEKKKKEEAC